MKRPSLIAATLLFLAVAGLSGSAVAQDTPVDSSMIWKRAFAIDLIATQTAYSDSWTGGEAGSFSWVSKAHGFAERKLNPWFNLRSQLVLSFGQTLSQDEETKEWSSPNKSTDLIDWETVGRFLVGSFVDPYVAFRLETQFYDGSVDAKKRYFSPLKLTESAGIAHRFYESKNDHITTRLGGAVRQIISQDFVDLTTYETETNTVSSAGFESVSDAVLTLNDKLQYTGKLSLFKSLYDSQKDDFAGTPDEDDWKAIDVNWENIVTAQLSKIIAVNFYAQVLYDKQIVDKARIKETLGIGFLFKLI